jgi:hypothetical protein
MYNELELRAHSSQVFLFPMLVLVKYILVLRIHIYVTIYKIQSAIEIILKDRISMKDNMS